MTRLGPCHETPDTCIDDMCRGSAEQGLCGNFRLDAFEDWGDDGLDDEYPPDDELVPTRRDQRGTAIIEWLLGFVFILLPAVGLAAAAVNWPDRLNAANTAAYEAAKTVLVTGDEGAATARAQDVWASHGYTDTIAVSYTGDLSERGGTIRATVTVVLPVIHFIGAGDAGGASWSTHHDERIADFGSVE